MSGTGKGTTMERPSIRTLSNRAVNAVKVEKDTVFWDRHLTGFGVRVYPTGGKVYIAQARGPEGPKRLTVGRHGVLGAEQARRRAAGIIARIKAGESPVAEPAAASASGPTVAEVAKRYLDEHVAVRYKPGSATLAGGVVNRYIVPEFGKKRMIEVERSEVLALHQRLCKAPSAANQVVRTLSLMYTLAADWGVVPEGANPCRSIIKYPQRKRERFLTDPEFDRLGRVLEEAETKGGASVSAIAALRLLMLTGCRKNEILTLRWEYVALNANELRLPDTKTGARVIPLSPPAVKVLTGLPRMAGSPWVLPGRKPGRHLRALRDAWVVVRERARLEDVRLHDLRHSYASRALALGESLPMIGKLLGHRQIGTTARYAHLARDTVHASAERIAASLAEDLIIDLPSAQ